MSDLRSARGRAPSSATSIAALLCTLVLSILLALDSRPTLAGTGTDGKEASDTLAVIVNSANDFHDPTFEELRSIFKLEQAYWEEGRRIVLVLPRKGSREEAVLLRKVYEQSEMQLRMTWGRRLFSGQISTMPESARSAGAIVSAVKRSRDAIGVVSIAGGIPAGVRVLAISGKRPGQPGYPLAVSGS